jgi:hypothetical protein
MREYFREKIVTWGNYLKVCPSWGQSKGIRLLPMSIVESSAKLSKKCSLGRDIISC